MKRYSHNKSKEKMENNHSYPWIETRPYEAKLKNGNIVTIIKEDAMEPGRYKAINNLGEEIIVREEDIMSYKVEKSNLTVKLEEPSLSSITEFTDGEGDTWKLAVITDSDNDLKYAYVSISDPDKFVLGISSGGITGGERPKEILYFSTDGYYKFVNFWNEPQEDYTYDIDFENGTAIVYNGKGDAVDEINLYDLVGSYLEDLGYDISSINYEISGNTAIVYDENGNEIDETDLDILIEEWIEQRYYGG